MSKAVPAMEHLNWIKARHNITTTERYTPNWCGWRCEVQVFDEHSTQLGLFFGHGSGKRGALQDACAQVVPMFLAMRKDAPQPQGLPPPVDGFSMRRSDANGRRRILFRVDEALLPPAFVEQMRRGVDSTHILEALRRGFALIDEVVEGREGAPAARGACPQHDTARRPASFKVFVGDAPEGERENQTHLIKAFDATHAAGDRAALEAQLRSIDEE